MKHQSLAKKPQPRGLYINWGVVLFVLTGIATMLLIISVQSLTIYNFLGRI